MARKGWNALSPGYKARLEKAGVSKSDYESGQSIKAARGHATTPERPGAANVNKFTRYVSERNNLIARVTQKKYYFFSTAPKWNPTRAASAYYDSPPTMAQLRVWAALSKEEWINAIREEPDTIAYLGYH